MSTLIKNLHIQNFKSVRDLSLNCDRINIFIGKPNAGKSNILEAVSLLGVNYYSLKDNPPKLLETTIRYKSLIHLFNNFNIRNAISITTNNTNVKIEESKSIESAFRFVSESLVSESTDREEFESIQVYKTQTEIQLASDGSILGYSTPEMSPKPSKIKKYQFAGLIEEKNEGFVLNPPHGNNFYAVIESHPQLRAEISEFLKPNGLEFLLDLENQRLAVIQKTADTLITFPLNLVPDTFQRYIFHLAAIFSNRDSVLLFEEPESHSYGSYIYELAQHILNDEGENQYFITTHNPYFLTPMLQEGKDVALFVTWFEDYQTHARRLTEEEISGVLNYGMDIFLNLKHFIPA